MQSEGPHKLIGGIVECLDGCYKITSEEKYIQAIKAQFYAEGRKAAENEIEEKKAVKDALLCGTVFMKDGKMVPPEDVYLSEAEIKLKKMENDFKELLELANKMRGQGNLDGVFDEFDAWKKARGIE